MKKIVTILTCFFVVLIFSGCRYTKSLSNKTEASIVIYKVSREVFLAFLEKPALEVIDLDEFSKNIYFKEDQYHIKHGGSRIQLQGSLFDFMRNNTEIKNYLLKNNCNGHFNSKAIIDAPNIPLTIWINTDQEDVYITINKASDGEYAYELYSSKDYVNKYGPTPATLNINGVYIQNSYCSLIYSNYADVPFLAVLEALGAASTQQEDGKIEITFSERQYILNLDKCELYEIGKESINLFHKDGGVVFVYSQGNELMIDSFTLNTILRTMGKPTNITVDKVNKMVSINSEA